MLDQDIRVTLGLIVVLNSSSNITAYKSSVLDLERKYLEYLDELNAKGVQLIRNAALSVMEYVEERVEILNADLSNPTQYIGVVAEDILSDAIATTGKDLLGGQKASLYVITKAEKAINFDALRNAEYMKYYYGKKFVTHNGVMGQLSTSIVGGSTDHASSMSKSSVEKVRLLFADFSSSISSAMRYVSQCETTRYLCDFALKVISSQSLLTSGDIDTFVALSFDEIRSVFSKIETEG